MFTRFDASYYDIYMMLKEIQFHREIISESLTIRHKAQSLLISERSRDNTNQNQGVIVFNTLPWVRSDVIIAPEKSTKWSNQQWNGEYEYLLGKYNKQTINIEINIFLVENIPGLGASGFIENIDFKSVSSEKAAKGKIIV